MSSNSLQGDLLNSENTKFEISSEKITNLDSEGLFRKDDCVYDRGRGENEFAICIRNLSKCYQIYENPRDRLKQFVIPRLQRAVGKKSKKYFREFWALKDVGFEVHKGETVGIIGRNGSGKSTLLQLICGTTSPTNGSVQSVGRIAALLELGSGFNPEFTGRENVYMNAAILGLTKKEIDFRFEEIANFADIGEFINHPVNTYSSGMYMRLAFAVAINVDPQILVVDEALSVGDEAFQRKCFSRIQQIKEKGSTILFVSHAASLIVEFCDRAILLDNGELLMSGKPKEVVSNYHKLMYASPERASILREEIRKSFTSDFSTEKKNFDLVLKRNLDQREPESLDFFDPELTPKSTIKYEKQGAEIKNVHIEALSGEKINVLTRGREYFLVYDVYFENLTYGVRWGAMIKTVTGLEIGGIMSHPVGQHIEIVERGATISARIKFKCSLLSGVYFFNAGVVGVVDGSEIFLDRIIDAAMFRVQPEANLKMVGIVDLGA